eukprot:2720209-Ditylum_brightwellii.AAC.1
MVLDKWESKLIKEYDFALAEEEVLLLLQSKLTLYFVLYGKEENSLGYFEHVIGTEVEILVQHNSHDTVMMVVNQMITKISIMIQTKQQSC